jgi:hypothetical protein
MDVKTRWNSTLELLERAYQLREFTREWLKNPKYSDYQPLFTTQDEWTIVKYVMEVLRRFRYWTLWMSKRHTVTLHRVITVYNDMFDHTDGVMRALVKKKTQWTEDLFFVVKWDKGMDINPEDETSYTMQYQEAFLKYVENECCAKHRRLPVIKSDITLNNNLSSFEMASRSGQSSYDPYDVSSAEEEYLIPTNVAETTPGRSDGAARLLTAARL